MDWKKLKESALVLGAVFIVAAGSQFALNVTNIFETPLATWQLCVNAGVIAVVAYFVAYFSKIVPGFGRGSE